MFPPNIMHVPSEAMHRDRNGPAELPVHGFVKERNGAAKSRFRALPTGSWRKAAIARAARQPDQTKGHDAMHRTRIFHTHPTHACSEHFRGFDAMLIASRQRPRLGIDAIPPFLAMADRISTEAAS